MIIENENNIIPMIAITGGSEEEEKQKEELIAKIKALNTTRNNIPK